MNNNNSKQTYIQEEQNTVDDYEIAKALQEAELHKNNKNKELRHKKSIDNEIEKKELEARILAKEEEKKEKKRFKQDEKERIEKQRKER